MRTLVAFITCMLAAGFAQAASVDIGVPQVIDPNGAINSVTTINLTSAQIDQWGTVAPAINPNTYFKMTEWDDSQGAAQFSTGGANGVNFNLANPSPTFATTSTIGTVQALTSTTTQGGRVCYPLAYGIVKSTTINYRWRHIFYMPVASDATNPYTAFFGNFVGIGTATSADLPFAGPYISYTHGTNGGNWVMGSAVNNTRTTGNSSTAPSFSAWSRLEIQLANGTYTFIVNGVTIGTLADANIVTSVASGQAVTLGCVMLFPGGAYTTARTIAIDRSDFYITGLSR